MVGILLVGLISCKKKTDDPPAPVPIITINFIDQFIPDQIPVIVMLSEPDGKLILDTVCSLNGTYTLFLPSGKSNPDQMMVTVVRSEITWHNLTSTINTYTDIANGSTWTIQGVKPDTLGNAHITLENMPAVNGPIIYANSGYHTLTFNPTNRTLPLYKTPDDLYIKIQTIEGQYFTYKSNLLTSGAFNIDMSNIEPTSSQSITLPMEVLNYDAELYGYRNGDFDSPIPILADKLFSDGNPTSLLQLNYPPSIFSGFHTKIMLQEDYMSENQWFYQSEGAIPTEFIKIDAEITAMQSEIGSLNVQSTGTYEMLAAHWQFVDHAALFYEWQVYTPNTNQTIILPEIGPDFKQMFSTLSLDSLNFQYTELVDLKQLSSYDALISKLFDTQHPTQMDRYEASILRKNVIIRK